MKLYSRQLSLLLISIVLLFASCSKSPDKILPKKNGAWNVVITTHTTSTAGYDSTTITNTITTFIKDGTGSYINSSGSSDSFTWSYSKDSKKITFQKDLPNEWPIVFDVTIMERKTEQWHAVYSEIIALDTYTTDLTYDLTQVN